jgi:hypothetical protein
MVIFVVAVDFVESFELAAVANSFVDIPFGDFADIVEEIVGFVDIAGIGHFVEIVGFVDIVEIAYFVEIVDFVDTAEMAHFVEIVEPVEEIAYLDS